MNNIRLWARDFASKVIDPFNRRARNSFLKLSIATLLIGLASTAQAAVFVTLITPGNNAVFNFGAAIPLNASTSWVGQTGVTTVTKMEYYQDNVLIATVNGAGPWNTSYVPTTGGTHVITVTGYFLNNGVTTTAIAGATITVNDNRATTNTYVVVSTPNPIGQPMWVYATVTGGTHTGTVTFKDGGVVIGTGTLNNGGASVSKTFTTGGVHSLTAEYPGDSGSKPSVSPVQSMTISPGASTTTLTLPAPPMAGQNATLKATITGYTPTGTVTFKSDGTTIGTASLVSGVATLVYQFPTVCGCMITASYAGDASNQSSTSASAQLHVTPGLSTTSLSVDPATAVVGQTVSLAASITRSNGNTAVWPITYKDGATVIGSTVGMPLLTTFTSTGPHSITATFEGDGISLGSVSAAKVVTVVTAATTTTTLTAPATAAPGQNINLSATVTGYTPTGAVTFKDGATSLGTVTLSSGGVATLSTILPTTGSHSITAVFAGDPDDLTSTSVAKVIAVSVSATTTLLTSPTTAVVGQSINLSAAVSGLGYAPTGTVTFKDGTTTLGTGTISSGTATFSTILSAVGTHSITAVYGADTYNTTSTSTATVITVTGAPTTTALTASATAVAGVATPLSATVTGVTPTGTVTFKDGAATLGTGTITAGVATYNATFTTSGTHSITAVYGGNTNNLTSTSVISSVAVSVANTTVTLTAPATVAVGVSASLSAAVTGVTPTGTVTFMDGATALGNGTITSGTATFSTIFTTAGSHSITAVYNADANNGTNTSAAKTVAVTIGATTTTLAASSVTVVASQNVTFTATVAGAAPTGTVTFKDGTTVMGTGTITSGVATYTGSFSTAGSHSITAIYGADLNNATSTSAAKVVTVGAAAATVTILSTSSTAVAGVSVILSASVTGYTPTGIVTFKDGTTVLGTGTLDGTNTATLSTIFTTAAVHSLTAVYAGDTNDATSTSTAVSVTVTGAVTTTALTAPATAVAGVVTPLSATVTGVTPTGTVTFKDGATTLGTGTITAGVATYNATFTTSGTHSITAVYGGNTNNLTSTSAISSVAVSVANTTVTLTAPATVAVGVSASLSAAVTGVTPTGTVTFMDGATALGNGTIASGTATFSTIFTTAGSHSITAVYNADANNGTNTSAAKTVAVTVGATTTTLTTSLASAVITQNVTLTAVVTGATPTGMVTFKDGTTTLGTGTITAGTATYTTNFATAGSHSITAVYGADTNNATSTSAAKVVTVTATGATTTTLTAPATSIVSQTVVLSATVTGFTPTGIVTFKDGTTTLGTGTLDGTNTATYNATFTTAGTHSLTAVYAGDTNDATSTSTAKVITVAATATTTTTLTAPASAVVGQSVPLSASVVGFTPTGIVTFKDGAATLGTGTLDGSNTATYNATFTTGGIHTLTAVYAGDTNDATSTSTAKTINVINTIPPVVSITGPASGGNYAAPANLHLTANASDSDGSVTQVAFYNGATLIGTVTTAPYVFDWNNVVVGSYTITAVATDNQGATTTSSAISITVSSSTAQVYYIYTDQLDTPRLITDNSNNAVWHWDNNDPFANNPVNDDPNTTGNHFAFNLRLPGQYFDAETNNYYNNSRDYDPSTGRYIESDSIGLLGGLNTYSYAKENPLSYSDPNGTNPILVLLAVGLAVNEIATADVPIIGASTLKVGVEVAEVCGKALSKAATLAANKIAGASAEAKAAIDLVAEGNTILGHHVSIWTSEGRRVVDFLVQTPAGNIVAYEIKSGGAVRTGKQVLKDTAMAAEGGIPVGINAPSNMINQMQAPIPTIVKQY